MEEEENKKENEEKKKLTYEELVREDGLFTRRVNLFLVAESLLFISYIASLNNECVSGIIGFLGLFITIFYLIILPRHTINIEILKKELKWIDPIYKEIKDRIMIPGYANLILGKILPITFLVGWAVLLAIKFCCCNC